MKKKLTVWEAIKNAQAAKDEHHATRLYLKFVVMLVGVTMASAVTIINELDRYEWANKPVYAYIIIGILVLFVLLFDDYRIGSRTYHGKYNEEWLRESVMELEQLPFQEEKLKEVIKVGYDDTVNDFRENIRPYLSEEIVYPCLYEITRENGENFYAYIGNKRKYPPHTLRYGALVRYKVIEQPMRYDVLPGWINIEFI